MKSWLAQGSSGRRVTLLPGTTFLHINGALGCPSGAYSLSARLCNTVYSTGIPLLHLYIVRFLYFPHPTPTTFLMVRVREPLISVIGSYLKTSLICMKINVHWDEKHIHINNGSTRSEFVLRGKGGRGSDAGKRRLLQFWFWFYCMVLAE